MTYDFLPKRKRNVLLRLGFAFPVCFLRIISYLCKLFYSLCLRSLSITRDSNYLSSLSKTRDSNYLLQKVMEIKWVNLSQSLFFSPPSLPPSLIPSVYFLRTIQSHIQPHRIPVSPEHRYPKSELRWKKEWLEETKFQ